MWYKELITDVIYIFNIVDVGTNQKHFEELRKKIEIVPAF